MQRAPAIAFSAASPAGVPSDSRRVSTTCTTGRCSPIDSVMNRASFSATNRAFGWNPAGVSSTTTVRGSGSVASTRPITRRPAAAVSPEPNSATRPGAPRVSWSGDEGMRNLPAVHRGIPAYRCWTKL